MAPEESFISDSTCVLLLPDGAESEFQQLEQWETKKVQEADFFSEKEKSRLS